jgi:hypothetical protein
MTAYRRRGDTVHLIIHNLGASWTCVVILSHWSFHPSRKQLPRYQMGPRASLDILENIKVSCPCQNSKILKYLAPASILKY